MALYHFMCTGCPAECESEATCSVGTCIMCGSCMENVGLASYENSDDRTLDEAMRLEPSACPKDKGAALALLAHLYFNRSVEASVTAYRIENTANSREALNEQRRLFAIAAKLESFVPILRECVVQAKLGHDPIGTIREHSDTSIRAGYAKHAEWLRVIAEDTRKRLEHQISFDAPIPDPPMYDK